jgi:hypothetical protein
MLSDIKQQKLQRNLSNHIPPGIRILPMPQVPTHILDHRLKRHIKSAMYQTPHISDACPEREDMLPFSWSCYLSASIL